MNPSDVSEFVARAEAIDAKQRQGELERDHMNEFVVVEPESGDYFLGRTLNAVSQAARAAYPERMTHAMRIGHKAALHFGLHVR